MNRVPLCFSLQDGIRVVVVNASKTAYAFTFSWPNGKEKKVLYKQVGRTRAVVKSGEPLEPYEHEALEAFWRYKV